MERCWCHAVMSGWLGGGKGGECRSAADTQRWRAECERAGSDCAARTEAIALRLSPAQASRHADTLRVFTAVGEIGFQNRAALQGSGVQHRYLGMLETSGHHVLWQRFRDGARFLLLSDQTGQHTPLSGLPRVSPDGRHLLVLGNDVAGRSNTLLLLQLSPRTVTPLFTFQAQGSALYGEGEWLTNSQARLTVLSLSPEGDSACAAAEVEMLACVSGTWRLQRARVRPAAERVRQA